MDTNKNKYLITNIIIGYYKYMDFFHVCDLYTFIILQYKVIIYYIRYIIRKNINKMNAIHLYMCCGYTYMLYYN